jgi:molecular chaperone HtpG
MVREKWNLSVNTENIFPIIKKWLYSDKDIFLREILSNAVDAIEKHRRLVSLGEAAGDGGEYRIDVKVSKKNKTIEVSDNGIGMTADEVKRYINEIAFSGAKEFLEKYKNDKDDSGRIIGHFGLGFYSSFMVSDKVEIDTLSYQEGAQPVKWASDGGTTYEMEEGTRKNRGTTVIMHISDADKDICEEYKVREIIQKYCSFMPYGIYLTNADDKKSKEDQKEEKPLNNTRPLYMKNPGDCTEEEYKEFYKEVFFDFNDPLFWIHLNMDYPFNLNGILYFPKLKNEFELNEGRIKLYYNQVFVADNIKEVIPEFLLLLKGVIDCPDLPLNVSRSFLQNDGYVQKISSTITRRVADKLKSLYNKERDTYNKYWDDIHPFVKYGCMREEKFYDRVKDIVIFKTLSDKYLTLDEYLDQNKDKHKDIVYYVSDETQQAGYIKLFKDMGLDAIIMPHIIDNHFMQFLEMKNHNVKFKRVDAELASGLKGEEIAADDKEAASEYKCLEKLFKEATGNDKLKMKLENIKSDQMTAVILQSEESRRMKDFARLYSGMNIPIPEEDDETLVLNRNNKVIRNLVRMAEDESKKETALLIAAHVYDMAVLGNKQLDAERLNKIIERSNIILGKIAESE